MKRFAFYSFFASCLSCLSAPVVAVEFLKHEDTDADKVSIERLDDLLSKSFRVQHKYTVVLDGSEKSSGLERNSKTIDEVVFVSPSQFRVRKELPFRHSLLEYVERDDKLFLMTPENQSNKSPYDIVSSTWLEILLAPMRIAEQWSLVPSNLKWSDFVQHLKKTTSPIKNAENDQLEYVFGEKGDMTLTLRGHLSHDSKTQAQIESVWNLSEVGQIKESSLNESLISRSF